MQQFNCNAEWSICLFDFTLKSKCKTQFVHRVGNYLTDYMVPDYFASSKVVGGGHDPPLADKNQNYLLMERNAHLCNSSHNFVPNFKIRYEA